MIAAWNSTILLPFDYHGGSFMVGGLIIIGVSWWVYHGGWSYHCWRQLIISLSWSLGTTVGGLIIHIG